MLIRDAASHLLSLSLSNRYRCALQQNVEESRDLEIEHIQRIFDRSLYIQWALWWIFQISIWLIDGTFHSCGESLSPRDWNYVDRPWLQAKWILIDHNIKI